MDDAGKEEDVLANAASVMQQRILSGIGRGKLTL